MRFYSHGKLLLTGEYLVLDGAKALALPTKLGQDLVIESIKEPKLIWSSFDVNNNCWFEAVFDIYKMRLISSSFLSENDGNKEIISETLLDILLQAKKLNPSFLETKTGFQIKTHLEFPKNWGLGSSSTLINNIASWAKVDAYQLLWNSFKGSGYDVACGQNNKPIFYQIKDKKPCIQPVDFFPDFHSQLFFIHLNKKQDSKKGIAKFRENKKSLEKEISEISEISEQLVKAKTLKAFEDLIKLHEQITSAIIDLEPVKKSLFPDYFGEVKSLGAWGGDFILATGNSDTLNYFASKGYKTIVSYQDMVL